MRALARFDLNDFPTYTAAFDTWLNLGEHLVYVQLKSPDLFQSVNDRLPGLVDQDFLETYGISLVEGRFYQRDFVADGMPDPATAENPAAMKGTIVMNEEAVRTLGLASPADAIGRHIKTSYGPEINFDFEIIGVTPNMYFHSPKKPIRAEVYLLSPPRFNALGIRYEAAPRDIAAKVEKVWTEFAPQVPFQYEFVDEMISAEMTRERNLAVALTGFLVTIVLVACLGLYGLAAFTAQRRTREIGIRKVLGASRLTFSGSCCGSSPNRCCWPT